MGEQGEQVNNVVIPNEYEVDLNDLKDQMLKAMLTKLAVILALPQIVGKDALVLRIQSEFADLRPPSLRL